jgi:hypothetical protein
MEARRRHTGPGLRLTNTTRKLRTTAITITITTVQWNEPVEFSIQIIIREWRDEGRENLILLPGRWM